MRIMIWSLLALNGMVAALWLSGATVPVVSRPAASPPALTAKRLELLSELPSPPHRLGAQNDERPQQAATALQESSPAAANGAAQFSTPVESAAPEDSPGAAEAAPRAQDTPPPAMSGSPASLSAGAGDPVAQQMPPQPIKSASAAAPGPAAVDTPAAPSTAPAAADVEPDGAACFRTAEFAPDARERIAAALQEAGLRPADLKSSVRPRYWVYWSGAPGAATNVERALKAAGLKDWYRVGGAREATISLGVYGQAAGARRRQSQLAARGVEAAVAERYAAAARLRWQVNASTAAVESARAELEGAGVRLESCR